jgi:hypothetical protein
MSKQKFNPIALDQILTDAIEETQAIQNELTNIDYADSYDDIVPSPGVSPDVNNLLDKNTNGASVNYDKVYMQLERLIENGNIALQVLGAIDPDVSGMEVAASTASLMNAIKNCVAEFTKIHMMHIKHQQVLETMRIKHEYKMLEMKARRDLYSGNDAKADINQPQTLIEWETEGATEYIKFLQNKNKES